MSYEDKPLRKSKVNKATTGPQGLQARLLNPWTDEPAFCVAWGFWDEYPRWFQEMERRKPLEQYLAEARAPGRIFFGIFDGNDLVTLVKFHEIVPGHSEVSTEAKRHRVNWQEAGKLIYLSSLAVFETMGYREIFAWIPSCHHSNLKMARSQGMIWDGVRMVRATGVAYGKPITWLRMSMKRHVYEDYHQFKFRELNYEFGRSQINLREPAGSEPELQPVG